MKDIIEAPSLDVFRSLSSADVVRGAMQGLGSAAPDDDVVADYVQSYTGDRFAESARYVRTYPEQLQLLGARLPAVYMPVQIITGRSDPLVPPGNAEDLHARLPNSKLDILDAGHFVWEEAADRYATLVVNWVSGGYLIGGAARRS